MGRSTAAFWLGALLTAGGAWASEALRSHRPMPVEVVQLERIPIEVGPWRAIPLDVTARVMKELNSDALLLREYAREAEPPVWLYVDYHRAQRLGAQIHSPVACYPGAGWNVEHIERTSIVIGDRSRPATWLTLVDSEGRNRLALYWYETRWGGSSREIDLKIDLIRSAVAQRPTDAALVRLSADAHEGDLVECRDRIERLLLELGTWIEVELPFSRAGA